MAAEAASSAAERQRGNELFVANNFGAAADAYTSALVAALGESHPSMADSAKILSNRAACYLKMGVPRKAHADAQFAIELAPDYAKAHHRLSKACEAMGKDKEARNAMRRARQLDEATRTPEIASTEPTTAQVRGTKGVLQRAVQPAEGVEGAAGVPGEAAEEGEVEQLPEVSERVEAIIEELRGTLAGSAVRRELVTELLALLQVASEPEAPKELTRSVAGAFMDAEGPAVLYDIESCMNGNWMADAKNGTMQKISLISKLPGPIGLALKNYRGLSEQNKTAAAEGMCSHPEHMSASRLAAKISTPAN